MPKRPKNRAQRRYEVRKQIKHHPSFWEKKSGKVTIAVLGVLLVGFVAYQLWPKASASAPPQANPTAAATTTKPPTPPAQPPAPPVDPNAKLESKDVKVGTGEEAKTG